MEGESTSMAALVNTAIGSIQTGLETIAPTALAIGAAALLVWAGFRLAAKLSNRGVGK